MDVLKSLAIKGSLVLDIDIDVEKSYQQKSDHVFRYQRQRDIVLALSVRPSHMEVKSSEVVFLCGEVKSVSIFRTISYCRLAVQKELSLFL